MQEGNEFEAVGRQRFPDGVITEEFGSREAGATENAIRDGNNCLFQATAIHNNTLARADVLQRVDSSDAQRERVAGRPR